MTRRWVGAGLVLAAVVAGVAGGPGRAAAPPPVVDEVAWSGTAAGPADEWIELYNPGPEPVDLAGWRLVAADGEPDIALRGVVPAGGYFLLERTDDTTVSDIAADLIYTGALHNGGEALALVDNGGTTVDTANGDGGSWPAGTGGPEYRSMARSDAAAPDGDGNWHHGTHGNGLDAQGHPINGTPRQANGAPAPAPTATATATQEATVTPETTATATPAATPTGTTGPEPTPAPADTGTPTPVATVEPTGTAEPQPSPTHTGTPQATLPATPAPSSTPTGAPGTPAPPEATPYATSPGLNEFMPDPDQDWNDDGATDSGDEYIELVNGADEPVDLGGWMLDDEAEAMAAEGVANPEGTAPYTIPPGTMIPGRGILVFYRKDTRVALNNEGDSVRLLGPDGRELERYDYGRATRGTAFSKMQEGGVVWTITYPPSPGAANRPGYSVDDVVRLNEVLASPRDVDWDAGGTADYMDEWVELINAGESTVSLGGWKLADGPPDGGPESQQALGRTYTLPAGTLLAPGQFLLVFRQQSGLALDAGEEWVRLLLPDGGLADLFHYDVFSGYDRSWCRLPDGSGPWSRECQETPGQANLARPGAATDHGDDGDERGGTAAARPTAPASYGLVSITTARGLPDGARAELEGQVTALPNVFDDKQIYIQDATGGLLVYLRSGEWPPLSEGQWVRVRGRMGTLAGEREIKLTRIDDISTLAPAEPLRPAPITPGQVGEAYEGRLVTVTAPVVRYWGDTTLYLEDGSGQAKVTVKQATGMRRPYVQIGALWAVTGIVSQSDDSAPYDGGYRLLPRRPADLQALDPAQAALSSPPLDASYAAINAPPLYLPVTGESDRLGPP